MERSLVVVVVGINGIRVRRRRRCRTVGWWYRFAPIEEVDEGWT